MLFIILISSKGTGLISDTLYVIFQYNSLSIQTLKMLVMKAADLTEVSMHSVLGRGYIGVRTDTKQQTSICLDICRQTCVATFNF